MNVLQDCLLHLTTGSQPVRGGGVELLDQTERARIAYKNLATYKSDFQSYGEKFAPFAKRIEASVLRMQSKINFHMVKLPEGDERFVQNSDELMQALMDGFEYNHKKHSHFPVNFENPCSEILLDEWGTTVLPSEARVIRSGSPYPKFLNSAQHRLLIRAIYRWLHPCNKDSLVVESLAHIKISKTMLQKLKNMSHNVRVTEMIYMFYNENKRVNYWHEIRQMRENLRGEKNVRLFAEGVAIFIEDAIGPKHPMLPAWRTDTVLSILRTIRETEDFSGMPILADALGDAGCTDEALLSHYRNPDAKFSLASWIFKATGLI